MTAEYKKLSPLQGNLKDLTEERYEDLKGKILELGFSEPISVWIEPATEIIYVLNGHQRLKTITKMIEDEGYSCGPIPLAEVEADDIQQAKLKILSLTSQFGIMDKQGLYEFMTEADLKMPDLEGFAFPDIDLTNFETEFFSNQEMPTESKNSEADPEFQQMSFILTQEQAAKVSTALVRAGEAGPDSGGNAKGAALALIANAFLTGNDG